MPSETSRTQFDRDFRKVFRFSPDRLQEPEFRNRVRLVLKRREAALAEAKRVNQYLINPETTRALTHAEGRYHEAIRVLRRFRSQQRGRARQ